MCVDQILFQFVFSCIIVYKGFLMKEFWPDDNFVGLKAEGKCKKIQ